VRAARRSARQSTKASVQDLRGAGRRISGVADDIVNTAPLLVSDRGTYGRSRAKSSALGRSNNAVPSVQSHYRTFLPTTDPSATVSRIGTLVLTALCIESSC
jgi:hypothetical protein